MNGTIFLAMAGGALAGGFAALIPSKTIGIRLLCIIPIVMVVAAHIKLSDPLRQPDALDVLLYFFAPLWPSVGAVAGFIGGRWVQRFVR